MAAGQHNALLRETFAEEIGRDPCRCHEKPAGALRELLEREPAVVLQQCNQPVSNLPGLRVVLQVAVDVPQRHRGRRPGMGQGAAEHAPLVVQPSMKPASPARIAPEAALKCFQRETYTVSNSALYSWRLLPECSGRLNIRAPS